MSPPLAEPTTIAIGVRKGTVELVTDKLPCDVCQRDIATDYRADRNAGWFSWWGDVSEGGKRVDVKHVHVSCRAVSREPTECYNRLNHLYRGDRPGGLFCYDIHLGHFAGKRPTRSLRQLLEQYPHWEHSALLRVVEIFDVLRDLPGGDER